MSASRASLLVSLSRCCGTASLVIVAQSSPAHAADSAASVEVSAGASAATNPFLATGTHTGAASAFIEVRPEYRQSDETSSLEVRGLLRGEQYSRRYRGDEAAAVSLDVTRIISERLKLRAAAAVRSSRSSALAVLSRQAEGLEPAPGLPPPPDDISVIGLRTRTVTGSASAGATFVATARDTWDADVAAGIYKYKSSALADYRYANQRLSYARGVTPRTSLQASLSTAEIDYLERRAGDAVVVSPLVGLETKLSARLTATAQVGASFSSIAAVNGGRMRRSDIAFKASLCGDRERTQFCVTADRYSQATALGTVTSLSSLAGSLVRRFSSQDTLQLNGNLSWTADRAGHSSRSTFAGAAAEFNHTVRDGFSLFAGADYSDISDRLAARRANFHARVGLRYRFGATR